MTLRLYFCGRVPEIRVLLWFEAYMYVQNLLAVTVLKDDLQALEKLRSDIKCTYKGIAKKTVFLSGQQE